MSETGQTGRPTTDRGYQNAQTYTANPDTEALPDFSHRNYENTFIGYLMANQKDLADAILTLTNTIPNISQYPDYIEDDTTLAVGYDGVTYSRGVGIGYTVTVSPGSILHWESEFAYL